MATTKRFPILQKSSPQKGALNMLKESRNRLGDLTVVSSGFLLRSLGNFQKISFWKSKTGLNSWLVSVWMKCWVILALAWSHDHAREIWLVFARVMWPVLNILDQSASRPLKRCRTSKNVFPELPFTQQLKLLSDEITNKVKLTYYDFK